MADITWTGAGKDNNLDNPYNWSNGSVPGAQDTALFTKSASNLQEYIPPGPDDPGTPTYADFAPGIISVAANASVGISGQDYNYLHPSNLVQEVPTLDIGNGATVSFVASGLIAGTVNNSGILNMSQATPLGTPGPNVLPSSLNAAQAASVTAQDASSWSMGNGFGSIPLVGVIGLEKFSIGGPSGSVAGNGPGAIPISLSGANDLGSNNMAIASIPKWYANDDSSYVSIPTFPGSGKVVDSLLTQGVDPATGENNWVLGFDPDGYAYNNILSSFTATVPATAVPGSTVKGADTTGGIPCFLAGTLIRTSYGLRRVEDLRPGDRIHTGSGLGTVKWVGRKTAHLEAMPDDARAIAAPVLILPDAFADGVPSEQVLLSSEHAVFVGGVLIPIYKLINGRTILRDTTAGIANYVHVELETHGIIPVAGLLCESFLDTGNRAQFDAECGVRPMHDNLRQDVDGLTATLQAYEQRGFAPLCLNGEILESLRTCLVARAASIPRISLFVEV